MKSSLEQLGGQGASALLGFGAAAPHTHTRHTVTCLGINLVELIDKLEVIEALTLVGVTEPRSMSHQ
jgi:hypothetical protein